MSEGIHLCIEILFLESQLPNSAEFRVRNRLLDELSTRNFGRLICTHSGAGIVDVDYRVRDETEARRRLAVVMGEIAPEVNYTVYRMLG